MLSRRLGKRSLLGARISAPPLLGDGVLVTTQVPSLQPELSKTSSPLASYEDSHSKEQAEESASQNQNWLVLQPGQQVSKWVLLMDVL